ncbi:LacI family transcriptional regulator [Aliiroseovarius sp. S1339]|uniref:LacI family DNA-binding transcriptional regulator n=1 Tax=Aliiroseovarius sp. S1339 TaxID=2936990 RepID=UPI0020C12FEF|nr:LacI family DNA-binding transcriptional regulator [Aliiroseovarius sp. S1339]MCK8464058.1 LacI family transcriptional regulator [Aliiroseovarius sp. S1339]
MSNRKIRNMEEFAAISGISRPTVSKYFNDPDSVRPSTREKIEKSLKKHNYRPNIFAMNQNRKLTKNLGVVVPYLADPFFAEIARRIETMVIAAGFRPILLSSHGDPHLEVENLESLLSIKPAGVLLAPLGRTSDKKAIERFCEDVPTVNFDTNLESAGEAFVGHNNAQATEMMLEYLTRTGEPPAFFEMKTPPNPNARKRRTAYVETMERMGHSPHIIQAEGEGWEFEEIGYREGKRTLSEGNLPSHTVFCSNDRLAIGFLAAAYELGLRVGLSADCSLRVAGHDNHPFSRFTCPTLTTVSHNYTAIATKSVETILALIESGDRAPERKSTLFDGELIMRASA